MVVMMVAGSGGRAAGPPAMRALGGPQDVGEVDGGGSPGAWAAPGGVAAQVKAVEEAKAEAERRADEAEAALGRERAQAAEAGTGGLIPFLVDPLTSGTLTC